jgi:hypothetical protein
MILKPLFHYNDLNNRLDIDKFTSIGVKFSKVTFDLHGKAKETVRVHIVNVWRPHRLMISFDIDLMSLLKMSTIGCIRLDKKNRKLGNLPMVVMNFANI